DDLHKRGVLALWSRMCAAVGPGGEKAIFRGTYAGWYCPGCEDFNTEEELKQPGNLCPDHERPSERTGGGEGWLLLCADWGCAQGGERARGRLRTDPGGRRSEVLVVVRDGLQDVSISRARVKWGIPVPDAPGHTFYVWMDALANYITALDYAEQGPLYRKY